MTISIFWVLAFFGAILAFLVVIVRMGMRRQRVNQVKQEAYFVSMFPDLQPYYHPRSVLEFVRARLAQEPAPGGMRMGKPPGFAVDAAEVLFQDDKGKRREVWRLLDAAGVELSRFMFEADAKDGMVRVGKGKFRVGRKEDRVRYWHPDREFKWTPAGIWQFVTRVFEEPVESNDRGGVSFADSSSSSSSAARTAAAATGLAAAAGTFDGGGASAAWDAGGGAGGGAAGEGAESDSLSAGATSY